MKTLYISDLDGTLLNAEQRVSYETVEKINYCIDKGLLFTFATARTAASAVKITEKININIPCVLMNGVCVYDIAERKYMKIEYIPSDESKQLAEILDELKYNGFMYKISENRLFCEFTELDSSAMLEFYEIRRNCYDKPFEKIENFSDSCNSDVIYFTLLDSHERLDRVRRKIENICGLKYEFYCDIYNENVWYLEIFSEHASKYNGVKFLREKFEFDKIICFGDNLNDIPLFKASDVRVAVENAKPELKALADYIAPSNIENGTAQWIYDNM